MKKYFAELLICLIAKIRKPFFLNFQKKYIRKKNQFLYEPIFVIGANRSGTSVCCKLIEDHPLLFKTHKDRNENLDYSTKKMIGGHSVGFSEAHYLLEGLNLNSLRKIKDKFFWGHPKNISYFYQEGYKDKIDISKLISIVKEAESHGKRAIIKDQLNTLRISLLVDIFPRAKFIFLKRDLENFLISNTNKWYGSEVNDDQVKDIVLHWTITNLTALIELKHYANNRYIEIDYKDITNTNDINIVKKTVNKIFDFLDLYPFDVDYSILSASQKFKGSQLDQLPTKIRDKYSELLTIINKLI